MRRLTRLDEVEYSVTSEGMRESARRRIGRITLDAKRPGKRRTGNPFAPFEVAGVGDGLTANLHGHEAGNGGHSQGEPTVYRANPRPDPDLVARLAQEAAKSARHLLLMCIRAIDYCPPVDITYGDYMRSLITADYDLVPEDDRQYRVA